MLRWLKLIFKRGISCIFIVLCALLLSEGVLRLFWRYPTESYSVNSVKKPPPIQPPINLFYPNLKIAHRKEERGRVIYDAVYTTDQFGRRVSSIEKGRAESHLLLFGCSYLFGVGVNDWESIPHYLAMQLPSFELSTYAIPAGSMSNMLAGLTTLPMREQEIKEEGALVYLMFPEIHARRVAGYLANPTYGFYNPKYRLKNGKLELEGSFLDADPWLSGLWMWAAKKSVLARELFVRMERGIHEEDYALAKQIVLESRDKYLSLFPNGRFIVATMERENELTQSLQAEGVEFIFLQDIMSLSRDDKFFIKGDGHFSAAGNLAIAEDLSKKLQAHLKKKQ